MEVSSTNPLNIQLATFAMNMEWKLQKQNEEKQSELSKRKELCQTKERPLSILSLYYSGPAVSSTCNECHPNSTSIFQKSFNVLTLKDLLHRPCIPSMKELKPCQEAIESLHSKGSLGYYFMKSVSWILYHLFSYKYRGLLIHPEQIQCVSQAQDTGSSILYFLPCPRLTNLCAVYFALYYSGLRPPLIGFDNLPWYTRWLFSMMSLLKSGGLTTHSLLSNSVTHFYSDYVNYVIDDIYVVPVTVSTDRFIHVNFSTPYALSELEIKYSNAELVDEDDIDDVRDIDAHVRTDCDRNGPITALAFVAYVVIACRNGDTVREETLIQGVERIRGEFIREKVGMNFKGTNENVLKFGLQLLQPQLRRRVHSDGQVEWVIRDAAALGQLVGHAMSIIHRKMLLCVLTAVVYTLSGVTQFVDGRLVLQSALTDCLCTDCSPSASDGIPPRATDERNGQSPPSVTSGQRPVNHGELVVETMQRVEIYEFKLSTKLFKFCQNPEDEINKAIGDLSDCQILSSTDKGQLVEEKWSANIARELEMGNDDEERNVLDTRTYLVEPYEKLSTARTYLNVVQSFNSVGVPFSCFPGMNEQIERLTYEENEI